MTTDKPREFWIPYGEINYTVKTQSNHCYEHLEYVHVIECSAVEKLIEAIENTMIHEDITKAQLTSMDHYRIKLGTMMSNINKALSDFRGEK